MCISPSEAFTSCLLFFLRLLTFNYLVAFNLWLLLCPRTLSYDWQVGSVPLVTTLSDIRNLATLAFYVTLTVAVCRCLQILTQQVTAQRCQNSYYLHPQ